MGQLFNLCLVIVLAVACSKDSPFSEDYGGRTNEDTTIPSSILTFSATLIALSSTLANISGAATLTINDTDFTTEVTLNDFPQSLFLGS